MATTPGNAINCTTTGITGFTGTGFTGTPATQYNVIIGGSTSSTLSNVAPSATSGVPLISQGSSSNPAFGTAAIAGGGTNATSFTQSNGVVTYNGTSLVNYAGPRISSSGYFTNTSQPICFAYLNSSLTNVTGDGTSYTVLFDSTAKDQTSGYNASTGQFTAPVTGTYFYTVQLTLTGVQAANNACSMTTYLNNATAQTITTANLGAIRNASNVATIQQSCMQLLSANDNLEITVIANSGTKTCGIQGNSFGTYSFYCIYLIG